MEHKRSPERRPLNRQDTKIQLRHPKRIRSPRWREQKRDPHQRPIPRSPNRS